MWDHQKLKVYAKALDAAVEPDMICRGIRSRRDLQDQIRRASASVVLNIAEGAGEFSLGEKARFYRIAKRSGAECAAALDLIARTCPGAPSVARADALLNEVVSMLTVMIRNRPERP